MNPGGEPERDDSGLPPVDIEIPDDARELDRDVQAYYRELRAQRRRQRRIRLHGSMARDGIVLPLLACCLILALITGTLLTVFTARSDQNLGSQPGFGTSTSTSPSRAHSPGAHSAPRATPSGSAGASRPAPSRPAGSGVMPLASPLPNSTLQVRGYPVPLHALRGTMLVLIPRACACAAAVHWLAGVSVAARAQTYLVGTPGTIGDARQLKAGLSARLRAHVEVALDKQGALSGAIQASSLSVVLVSRTAAYGQSVAYAQGLTANDKSLAADLRIALTT